MAHFAKLNDRNEVIEIHCVNNEVLDQTDEENSGIKFLTEWSGAYSNWKQTSYNGAFRYNFAGIGYIYDPIDDAFIPPMPECYHDELELNEFKQWVCLNTEHNLNETLA